MWGPVSVYWENGNRAQLWLLTFRAAGSRNDWFCSAMHCPFFPRTGVVARGSSSPVLGAASLLLPSHRPHPQGPGSLWFWALKSPCSTCGARPHAGHRGPLWLLSLPKLGPFSFLSYMTPNLWGHIRPKLAFSGGARGKEPTCQCRRQRCEFETWVGKMAWWRACSPLLYSCLENPMDRGPWQATVHRVAQSQTQLKWQHAYTHARPNLGNNQFNI